MDTNTIDSQLTYLEETKLLLKDAIINKGQVIQDSDTFRSYVDKIDQISTLAEETADADATANDILKYRTAYVNGEKITGSLNSFSAYGSFDALQAQETALLFTIGTGYPRVCFSSDTRLTIEFWRLKSVFNLTSDKLLVGNNIMGVEGTATADATAASNDILNGQTAYVNGEKITGTLNENTGVGFMDSTEGYWSYSYEGNYLKPKCHTNSRILLASGAEVEMYLPFAEVANFIGLTSDKIIEGNTILGIAGTGKTSEDLQAQLDAQDELIASQQAQIEELKSLLADKASNITNESIETVNNVLGNEEV